MADNKTKLIAFRLTEEEADELRELAEDEGKSVSQFVREAILIYVHKYFLRQAKKAKT